MNKIIQTIIAEKVSNGEVSTVSQAQAVISRISDSRVSEQDIVNAIVEISN